MMIMVDSMKTKGRRNLFFTCFRPVDVDDGAVEKRKHKEGNAGDMVTGDGGQESMVTLSSLSDRSKKERSRRSFSRVLKAMLFETSLSKKTGSKKSRENSFRSSSNSSSKFAKIMNSMKGKSSSKRSSESEDINRSNSSGSSLFSSSAIGSSSLSSSSSSSFASNSRSASERRNKSYSIDLKQVNNNNNKQMEAAGGCYFSSNVGLCFVLVCVLVLIIWGKVFAIFCTSLCFYFAPRRPFKVIHPRVNDVDMVDIDSEESKKRVIMEGLLERNRTRML